MEESEWTHLQFKWTEEIYFVPLGAADLKGTLLSSVVFTGSEQSLTLPSLSTTLTKLAAGPTSQKKIEENENICFCLFRFELISSWRENLRRSIKVVEVIVIKMFWLKRMKNNYDYNIADILARLRAAKTLGQHKESAFHDSVLDITLDPDWPVHRRRRQSLFFFRTCNSGYCTAAAASILRPLCVSGVKYGRGCNTAARELMKNSLRPQRSTEAPSGHPRYCGKK